jgi:hypothetical protein
MYVLNRVHDHFAARGIIVCVGWGEVLPFFFKTTTWQRDESAMADDGCIH